MDSKMMYFKNITNEKQMKGGMICGSKNGSVGEFCMLQRPEMKVERVSYDVMTPSAARGNARGSILAPRPAVAY